MEKQTRTPPFVPAMVGRIIGDGVNSIGKIITSQFVYSISSNYFTAYIDTEILRHYFPHIPYGIHENENGTTGYEPPTMQGDYYDWFIYKGTPIVLHLRATPIKDDGSGNMVHHIEFQTIRMKKHMKHLRSFYKKLAKDTRSFWDNNPDRKMEIARSQRGILCRDIPDRNFDNVFIPKVQQDEIVETLSKFVQSRDWYKDHRIPYHFGLILHGEPGTGKSSVIQAVMNSIDCDILYIDAADVDQFFGSNGGYNPILAHGNTKRPLMVIVEDIDTVESTHHRDPGIGFSSRDKGEKTSREILGTMLNFMDGIIAPSNVIYVFTTNHIEEIDPALIRPGRIDMTIHIDYVCNETFDRFLKFHYGKSLPSGYTVREKTIFASIQTDVMMQLSFDEIVEKYCIRIEEESK